MNIATRTRKRRREPKHRITEFCDACGRVLDPRRNAQRLLEQARRWRH